MFELLIFSNAYLYSLKLKSTQTPCLCQQRVCGFSLVEMLIALSLGLLIIAALGQIFSTTIRNHGRTLATASLQENMRLIDAFVGRAADRAGYLGCLGNRGNIAKFLRGSWRDLPEYDLSQPVAGFENLGNGRFSPSIENLPLTSNRQRLHKPNNGIRQSLLAPTSDVLVLRGMGEIGGALRHLSDERMLMFEVSDHHLEPDNGDVLVITDCHQGALFSASTLRRSGSMVSMGWEESSGLFGNLAFGVTDAGEQTLVGLSLSQHGFAPSSILAHVVSTVFFVGQSQAVGAEGQTLYSLWQKDGSARPTELVRGVKDMQVLYGVKRAGVSVDVSDETQLFVEQGVIGYYQWDQISAETVVASIWLSFVIESSIDLDEGGGSATLRSFSLTYVLKNLRPRVLEVSR